MAIYRIAGVRDTGGADNTGIATSFMCSNYSGVAESLKIRIVSFNGSLVAEKTFTLSAGHTFTVSTRATNLFGELDYLAPGTLINPPGQAVISASTPKIACSAMIVDAAAAMPNGIPLHMVRFNPQSGTEE